jgi:hypothetical protein
MSEQEGPAMKDDSESELRRLCERMLRAGTNAGQKTGDVAHQAMRQWASIWHRLLEKSSYFPGPHDLKPTHQQVAARAYEIWKSKGCPLGSADEDWNQAERQLTAH